MQKPRLNLYKDLYRDVLRWRSLGLPENEARKLCLAQYKSLLGANFNLNKASKEFERAWTSRRKDFPFTDLGNAERIAYDYGRDLRYCHQMKKWLIWRSTRWEIDGSGGIDRRAKRTVRKIYAEASQINDDALRKMVVDWARQCESRGRISAMIALARSDARILVQPEELDADPWLLNCQNGTLDLKASKLLPHDRDHLITKITPVKYDPDAKCKLWKEFLLRIMGGNEKLIGFLQRVMGYALTGDASEQCLFMLHGWGANGKSTFLETVRKALGDYAKQSDFDTFLFKKYSSIRNDIARLKGARFVSAVEVERGERLAANLVKQVTGQDTLLARFLYQEHFEFVPEFKIFLAVNHKPSIDGSDYAIWRRIHLIPLNVGIPEDEQDKELNKKLEEELPGILKWAVDGCYKWRKMGLDTPVVVRNAVRGYREQMDVIGRFIKECCEASPNFDVKTADIYEAYIEWCEENGERPESKKGFGMELARRGFEASRISSGRYRQGIRLKEMNTGEQGEVETPMSEARHLPRRGKVVEMAAERRLPRRTRQ